MNATEKKYVEKLKDIKESFSNLSNRYYMWSSMAVIYKQDLDPLIVILESEISALEQQINNLKGDYGHDPSITSFDTKYPMRSESKTAQPTDGEIYLEAERISKAVHVFPFDKVSWQYGAQAMRDGLIPKR